MKKHDVIRAWRDPEYFWNLSDEQRAQLPASPVGLLEVEDQDLNGVAGGTPGGSTLFSCQGTIICTPCEGNHCA